MSQENTRAESLQHNWLPEFCTAPVVFFLIVAAQIVSIIAVFAPTLAREAAPPWLSLGPASLLAQWITLTTTGLLCLLRRWLHRLPPLGAAFGVALVVLGNAYMCGWLSGEAIAAIYPDRTPDDFLLRVMALSVLVALVALRYIYVQKQWQRQLEATAEMQVQALTARIRPHFLFNTLNTATALISSEPSKAESVLVSLAELFRAALKAGDQPIRLEQELELARGYLAIEQQRIGGRLRTEIKLEQAPLDYLLPPLLLQPLVENAVYHGVQPLEEGGLVQLECILHRTQMELRVINPRPASSPAVSTTARNGMALDNVRARLQLAFKGRAELRITANATHYQASLFLPLSGMTSL